MNDPVSPYQAPQANHPYMPPMPPPGAYKPAVATVFGIMHIVFGGLSILIDLFSIIGTAVQMGMRDPIQMRLQEKMGAYKYVTGGLDLVISILMLVAGIKLVTNARDALKWNRSYSFGSMGKTVIAMFYMYAIVLPAMNEVMQGGDARVMVIAKGAMGVGTTISFVLAIAYAVLALVLMNRSAVVAWFEKRVP